jgi:hypothetical protein
MDSSSSFATLCAGCVLAAYGILALVTYRDPDRNDLTRLVDWMWKQLPPLAAVHYRTWYALGGGISLAAGIAFLVAWAR